ncbi:hypothetical protein ACGGZK_07210 [Agromyces sp. MMS24-K17]|uniref:hypothetical protein n=1 Tax=Agromyces sp. MMS24-K17 TaxID=3372850 RepID=UPI0037541FEF
MTDFVDPLEEPLVQERGFPVDTEAEVEPDVKEFLDSIKADREARAAGEADAEGK